MTQESKNVIDQQELLNHWQGHRALTRRVIDAFPEQELFNYSIGGMRTFANMVMELLGIGAPGLKEIVTGKTAELNEHFEAVTTKAQLLALWDEASEAISNYWPQIAAERFPEEITTFGQYKGTVASSIFYFIDNEIHHRGQGYVYLRALGIDPPFFWDRA